MSVILDLSNEILHRIIQAVPRNDLLSLSLTSKWLHALCDKALKRHLTLKKYSTVSFGNYWSEYGGLDRSYNPEVHGDAKDALLLIRDIIRDSEIMEYPESMCLGSCVDVGDFELDHELSNDDEKEIDRKRQFAIIRCSKELKRMIEDCDFILEDEKETSFTNHCNPRTEGVAVVLALTMLPNLKRITAQDWKGSYSRDRICLIVARIAETNQDPHSLFHNKALTDLREFFMSYWNEKSRNDLEVFISFAMLPSMRYIGGTRIFEEDFIPVVELCNCLVDIYKLSTLGILMLFSIEDGDPAQKI